MTLAYASPEQLRGEAITTASDVYSLGAVLYELLAGRPAHAVAALPVHEAARVVGEQAPVRPSTVSGQCDLRGDLDNVVLKAMHREPARRYLSAAQMAADVSCYLDGLPVIARHERGYQRSLDLWQTLQTKETIATGDRARIGEVIAALKRVNRPAADR